MQQANPNTQPTLRVRTGFVHHRADGITEVVMDAGAEVTYADAVEIVEAQKQVQGPGRYPTLVKMGLMKSINREARNRVAGEESAAIITAVALLMNSPISRVIGNFMMGFNASTYPKRLFTNEAEAVAWLLDHAK